MLEHARARDAAVLGNVADQHQRCAAVLGVADQLEGTAAHLADRTGRALDGVGKHRLDRIDHQQCGRLHRMEAGENVAHAGRRGKLDRRVTQPETRSAQSHLPRRLFAADVDCASPTFRDFRGRLEQQRRLADPRIAAHQDRRARHETAAERAVEFGEARSSAVPAARRVRRGRRTRPPGRRSTGRASARRRSPARPRPACSTPRNRRIGPASGCGRCRKPGRRNGVWAWPWQWAINGTLRERNCVPVSAETVPLRSRLH